MTFASTSDPIVRAPSSLFRGLRGLFAAWKRRIDFKQMLTLDDHLLTDMGVTRAEVQAAARLPLWVDAAEELRRMSDRRRGRTG